MLDRGRPCIGCGGAVNIPIFRGNKGPYCRRCMTTGAPAKPSYDYPTAFSAWGAEEHAAIERVIASGRFTMGPEVAAFEREFADWHGRKHGIMVNSGSSANLVMVSALRHLGKIAPLDHAVVPAIAWSTTYAPVIQNDLLPILCDVDASWNAAIGERAHHLLAAFVPKGQISLVIGCSILGNPADMIRLRHFADNLGATLIEDNCESLGAISAINLHSPAYRTGTQGLMSSFSFFHSHQISAIEGGMILTDDDLCAEICRILRSHGWTRDVAAPASFEEEYDFRAFGYNVRALELHAAIAREQLKKLPGFLEARRRNLALFRKLTETLPIKLQAVDPDDIPAPFGLAFECPSREARQKLVGALRAGGIDCRLPTGGSFRKHVYGRLWATQNTPTADRIHERALFLGNAPYDIEGKIEKAAKIIGETLCTA